MSDLERIPLDIGNPPVILTIRAVERFKKEGSRYESCAFKGDSHYIVVGWDTAVKQLSRAKPPITPEQAVGQSLKFEKVPGGERGFINIYVAATVARGEMTAPLTKPAPVTKQPISAGPANQPFDEPPIFGEDGQPEVAVAPNARAQAFALRRQWVADRFTEALHLSYAAHLSVSEDGDTYITSAEAVNAGAATIIIAWDRAGLMQPEG